VGKTKRGYGEKLMAVADGAGLPLAIDACSATLHEVTLVTATLAETLTQELPDRLIGEKAYDSDGLEAELAAAQIEMIAPHRKTHQQPTQDGRALRRYARRWKVERLFAWLQSFRRIATRFESHIENYLGFIHLGCSRILLRAYL